METKWTCLLLALLSFTASTVSASSICSQFPYDTLAPLSTFPPAASYCSSNFPLAPCTSTVVTTGTQSVTTTLSFTAANTTVTAGTVTVTTTVATTTENVITANITDTTITGTTTFTATNTTTLIPTFTHTVNVNVTSIPGSLQATTSNGTDTSSPTASTKRKRSSVCHHKGTPLPSYTPTAGMGLIFPFVNSTITTTSATSATSKSSPSADPSISLSSLLASLQADDASIVATFCSCIEAQPVCTVTTVQGAMSTTTLTAKTSITPTVSVTATATTSVTVTVVVSTVSTTTSSIEATVTSSVLATTMANTTVTVIVTSTSTVEPSCTPGILEATDGFQYSVQCDQTYIGGNNILNVVTPVANLTSCANLCEAYVGALSEDQPTCTTVVYNRNTGECSLLANTHLGGGMDLNIDSAVRVDNCTQVQAAPLYQYTSADGNLYVASIASWSDYQQADVLGSGIYNGSYISDGLHFCDETPGCGFMNVTTEFLDSVQHHFEFSYQLLRRKTGGYCMTYPPSDTYALVKVD